MGRTNQLFLIPVLLTLVRTQKPHVSMVPNLSQVYTGDTFNLICNNSGSSVQWFFNDIKSSETSLSWEMTGISAKNSGSYRCESNGQRSDDINISVLGHLPSANLFIQSGLPVIQSGSSVVLKLEVEDGLEGWTCWLYDNRDVQEVKLKKTVKKTELMFQPYILKGPIGFYWCSDQKKLQRSSMVTLRTSGLTVLMETPWPAVMGDHVTLTCAIPGVREIERIVFYKDNEEIQAGSNTFYPIGKVIQSHQGLYRCKAKYKSIITGQMLERVSEDQKLFVMDAPLRASLSETSPMSCSCSMCPDGSTYRWYHQQGDRQWVYTATGTYYNDKLLPGNYACKAIWQNGKTSMSNIYKVSEGGNIWLILLGVVAVLVVVLVVAVVVIIAFRLKKRKSASAIYEDMPMMGVKEDGGYEQLHKRHDKAEYDTLKVDASHGEDGDPRPKRSSKKDVVSVTAAPSSREGGYEQLSLKRDADKDEYQTITADNPAVKKKNEEYEALKTAPAAEGVYHTLGPVTGAEGAQK